MTPDKQKNIIEILSRISHIPVDEITLETDIFDDLEIDSLSLVELFVSIEKQFNVGINPSLYDRESVRTPRKILSIINI